jgi:membrane protein YqaA with SNARE-associated domain
VITAAASRLNPARPLWERRTLGLAGLIAAFLWGLAEATFFFIIPDVFLSFVAMLDWSSTWRHIVAALAGALLGGALLFHWAQADPKAAQAAVARVPFIAPGMLAKANSGLDEMGLLAVLTGSVSGVPYKLYAVEAPRISTQLVFLLATPPARAVRFTMVWVIFGAAAGWLRRRYALSTRKLIYVHAVVWIAAYAFYWGRIVYH